MPTWNKKTIAQNYDFGRPLDKSVLLKLFEHIKHLASINTLLDAGCGTGRITIPLAKYFPDLHITGVDNATEMLDVINQKITVGNIKNYTTKKEDLLHLDFDDNTFDISLISSVLHGITDWQKAVDEIIRVTKSHGYLLLISEQSDLYDLGLGRIKKQNNDLLHQFWNTYLFFRKKNSLTNTETSQVGITWQLGHPSVLQYLNEKHTIAQKNEIKIPWENVLTISDFMKIIKAKPWSSMFLEDNQKYQNLITDMENWMQNQHIDPYTGCHLNNVLLCEIVKIEK